MRTVFEMGDIGDTIKDRKRQITELEEIERRIAERKAVISQANERATSEPDLDLACKLHTVLCHANHTDGCGWMYEFDKGLHNWGGADHQRYLKKSRTLIAMAVKRKMDPEDLIDIMTSIRDI